MAFADLDLVTDFDPIAQIEADSRAFAAAAERDMDARVEHCPQWSVADLVWHLREVQYFWGTLVAERLDDPERVTRIDRPDDDRQLLDDFRAGADAMTAALAGADPHDPVWTWGQRQDAGFVIRHQVQEAAVHRWDAQNATGRPEPLEAAAATDAVDEFLTHSLPGRAEDAAPLGSAVVLRTTDTDMAWRVEEDGDGAARFERGAGALLDVSTVAGTASDVLLYLYRRVPASALDVTGDADPAERLPLRTGTD